MHTNRQTDRQTNQNSKKAKKKKNQVEFLKTSFSFSSFEIGAYHVVEVGLEFSVFLPGHPKC
jgi:lipocalin